MSVVGAELRTTFMNNECFSVIPAFWQQQRSENILHNIPHKVDADVILGLYTNYTSDFSRTSGHFSLIIGAPVTYIGIIPKNMVGKEIPAEKYAAFTAKGPYDQSIANTWQEIWSTEGIERTFTNDFERYDSASTNDENSIVKIYISIK